MVVAVVDQVAVQLLEEPGRGVRVPLSRVLHQREEHAGAVAGLGDAVGVEEQLVLGGEGDGVDAVAPPSNAPMLMGGEEAVGATSRTAPAWNSNGGGCPQLTILTADPSSGISASTAVAKDSVWSPGSNAV